MKTIKKELRLLLILWVMIVYLSFSAISQVITVNNHWICFDPVAAQQLENDIQLRRFTDSINNIMAAQYDSAILVKDEQIKIITGDVKCLETDNEALQVINQQVENKAKKEKRVSFLKGMGAGGLIIAILAIIF